MKRTPLRPSRTPIARHTKLRARKADPSKRRFAKRRCKPFMQWLWEQPCVLADSPRSVGCFWGVECCHVKSRGAGGDDRGNAVPMCGAHHRQQHCWGIQTFQEFYHVDLVALARAVDARYQREAAA